MLHSCGVVVPTHYLEFFCKKDLLLHLLMYSIIYLQQYGIYSQILYPLGYNPMLYDLLYCSNCSGSGHWELFQLAPHPFDLLPSFCLLSASLLSGTTRGSRLIFYFLYHSFLQNQPFLPHISLLPLKAMPNLLLPSQPNFLNKEWSASFVTPVATFLKTLLCGLS